jgi:hypothetical protein
MLNPQNVGLASFWRWYERHLRLNITIAASLFILQLFHLYWLTVEVALHQLFGLTGLWLDLPWLNLIITLVDYTEIPALITTSLVYINELRRRGRLKPLLYLIFLNSQWLHLFWITDEFVVDQFTSTNTGTILPIWLAWIAIGIDYLELPVILDLFVKLFRDLTKGDFKAAAKKLGSIK